MRLGCHLSARAAVVSTTTAGTRAIRTDQHSNSRGFKDRSWTPLTDVTLSITGVCLGRRDSIALHATFVAEKVGKINLAVMSKQHSRSIRRTETAISCSESAEQRSGSTPDHV